MTVLSAIRDRFSPSSPSTSASASASASTSAREALPFAGYDRLNDRQVVDGLSDHSQIDLDAAESYERSHKNRLPVLDKLRYMRQREPLPDYDALSTKEVLTALKDADLATIKRVRGYERKFANRRAVLEEVVRVHHARQASQPASGAPSYQPMSATSASRPPVDLAERSARP